jgi:hypothetical protein
MILLMGSDGCSLFPERDVLVRDSEPYHTVQNHATDPGITGYFVEAKRIEGDAPAVDVFELGSVAEYAKRLSEIALPSVAVVLCYDNGDSLQISPDEYRHAPDQYKTHDGQALRYSWYVPENMRDMDALMSAEQSRRMQYSEGSYNNYLASAEKSDEGNYNQIDGQINNEPPRRADLTDGQTHDEIAELVTQASQPADKKPSIGGKLRAGKEKADASKGLKPVGTTKKREKEID